MTKHVVVTGCSKGIGKATALYLDRQGYTVWASVRKANDAEMLKSQASQRLQTFLMDITDPQQVQAAAEQVQAGVGDEGVFALVNNAVVMIPCPLEVLPIEILHQQMAVVVDGTLRVTQAFLPLVRQAKGTIVNMSSIAGRIALPVYGPYHMAKFALEAMSDTLRQEVAPDGVRVVVIEPGAVNTPIWDTVKETAQWVYSQVDQQKLARYQAMIDRIETTNQKAVQRAVPPEKVAKLIERVINKRRPRARYPVGLDGLIIARLAWMFPASWRDWVASKL